MFASVGMIKLASKYAVLDVQENNCPHLFTDAFSAFRYILAADLMTSIHTWHSLTDGARRTVVPSRLVTWKHISSSPHSTSKRANQSR